MARGLFVTGFTIAEVLAIQAVAKALILEGKTIMNWSDAETSASKQFSMPPDQVLDECAHALKALDPDTYGSTRMAGQSKFSGYMQK